MSDKRLKALAVTWLEWLGETLGWTQRYEGRLGVEILREERSFFAGTELKCPTARL
jgi:hypothetical protein